MYQGLRRIDGLSPPEAAPACLVATGHSLFVALLGKANRLYDIALFQICHDAPMTLSHESGSSAFKRAQQRHRRRGDDPFRSDDLEDLVVDFSRRQAAEDTRIQRVVVASKTKGDYIGPWYTIAEFPGFLYAPQALSSDLQTQLAYLSVSEFCERPHATNIDGVPPKEGKEYVNMDESMWEVWKGENGFDRRVVDASSSGGGFSAHSTTKRRYRSFSKLSWATMGYQYDWTSRAYHEGAKSPMPAILSKLACIFAKTSMRHASECQPQFTASAAIVNYYNTKSTMGGHKDDLELALDKPVVSFSLGLPAVFLLGGKSKDETPVIPILVRPGDVMILGGESRLCYHGMARVIPASAKLPDAVASELSTANQCSSTKEDAALVAVRLQDVAGEIDALGLPEIPESELQALQSYLKHHRVNINVRQVLPDGMSRID
jgi:DNA alkylation damage repair protein AlkB